MARLARDLARALLSVWKDWRAFLFYIVNMRNPTPRGFSVHRLKHDGGKDDRDFLQLMNPMLIINCSRTPSSSESIPT